MGRSPCCAKEGLNRGAWSAREDKILTNYIKAHGEGKWRDLPQRAGLKRCGKSCRLRWLNYLRPDIKRGNISLEEEELIIKLHKLLGNRWSLISGRLPGRTDNEIKNYWNTNLSKRIEGQKKTQNLNKKNDNKMNENGEILRNSPTSVQTHRVIRTKAVRCTRVIIPQLLDNKMVQQHCINNPNNNNNNNYWDHDRSPSSAIPDEDDEDSARQLLMDFDISDLLISDILSSEGEDQSNNIIVDQAHDHNKSHEVNCGGDHGDNYYNDDHYVPVSVGSAAVINNDSADETLMLENWRNSESLQQSEALEMKTLASFFSSDDENLLFVVP